jgi:hypothetical protein
MLSYQQAIQGDLNPLDRLITVNRLGKLYILNNLLIQFIIVSLSISSLC